MLAALTLTSEYVTHRHQFGRPIGSFQSIQHRLATSYVKAEGARWLTRRASATPGDEYLTACAATFACVAAEETLTATHQSSCAIGLTTEHDLVTHTMRLAALQRELGGKRRHARRAAGTRANSPNATSRLHRTASRDERGAALNALS
jgi:alkylation response protein AidB-like acyl-CoA dehydrogenase